MLELFLARIVEVFCGDAKCRWPRTGRRLHEYKDLVEQLPDSGGHLLDFTKFRPGVEPLVEDQRYFRCVDGRTSGLPLADAVTSSFAGTSSVATPVSTHILTVVVKNKSDDSATLDTGPVKKSEAEHKSMSVGELRLFLVGSQPRPTPTVPNVSLSPPRRTVGKPLMLQFKEPPRWSNRIRPRGRLRQRYLLVRRLGQRRPSTLDADQ